MQIRQYVVSCSLILSGLILGVTTVDAANPPYSPSPVIESISWDTSSKIQLAPGSDNWPVTWCEDNHQYTAWGDGGGFGGTNSTGRVSLGFARVEGDYNAPFNSPSYRTYNIWGGVNPESSLTPMSGKSYGLLCLQEDLYMWVQKNSVANDMFPRTWMMKSTDKGRNWSYINSSQSPVSFTSSQHKLMMPTILQFGKNYDNPRDQYVYHYFIKENRQTSGVPTNGLTVQGGPSAPERNGTIFLARVLRDDILDQNAYQFFAGLDNGRDTWTTVDDIEGRVPVFQDPNGVGWNLTVSYNYGIGRYILMTEHTETSKGHLGIFDAPEPWGPWTTVGYYDNWLTTNSTFYWQISQKWSSGTDFAMVYTGIGSQDAWNTIKGRFTLKETQPIKIMPLGDSITQGYDDRNTYRRELWQRLQAEGYNVDFVGSTTAHRDGSARNNDFDQDHEGHWGYKADQVLDEIDGWLDENTPDIVLLHLGTNDIYHGNGTQATVDQTIEELGQVIDRLRAANPSIQILMAKVIPHNRSDRPSLDNLNAAIPTLVSQKYTQQSPIILVDHTNGFNPTNHTYDNVHPNDAGETIMATNWFNALKPVLDGQIISPPLPDLIVPGRIQAENFTNHQDVDTGNHWGEYRPNVDADIKSDPTDESNYLVGRMQRTEWLEYEFEALEAATYRLSARIAQGGSDNDSRLRFSLNGTELTTLSIPSTGGWNPEHYQNFSVATLTLNQGYHRLQLYVEEDWLDLDWLELTLVGDDFPSLCHKIDYNNNLRVDLPDYLAFASNFLSDNREFDFNGDFRVNLADYLLLSQYFLTSCDNKTQG